MDAVIFIGIQASGKSTFFGRRFAAAHVRLGVIAEMGCRVMQLQRVQYAEMPPKHRIYVYSKHGIHAKTFRS